jgi:hypothetical protein
MAVRLSALRVDRSLPPGRFLVLISVRGWIDPRAIVRLEGLGQLKNLVTSSGIEPATFRLVVPQPTTLPRAPIYLFIYLYTKHLMMHATEISSGWMRQNLLNYDVLLILVGFITVQFISLLYRWLQYLELCWNQLLEASRTCDKARVWQYIVETKFRSLQRESLPETEESVGRIKSRNGSEGECLYVVVKINMPTPLITLEARRISED